MKRSLGIMAVVALCLSMGSVANANLVVNGGFETGDFAIWTFVISSPDFSVTSAPPPHSGMYAAYFNVPGFPAPTEEAYFHQEIPTIPGVTYHLSYWATYTGSPIGPMYPLPPMINVIWGGLLGVSGVAFVGPTPWTKYENRHKMVATSSTTDLYFEIIVPVGELRIDDISVVAAPVTLPGIMLLLGTGLQ
jgi:hypothetical protein